MIINFKNIKLKTAPTVYTPAEDTFFLEDVMRDNIISTEFQDHEKLVAEMGCGSGYITVFLMKLLPKSKFYAIDINKDALQLTLENIQLNNLNTEQVNFLQSNLFSKVDTTFFDLILFNPPYLPPENNSFYDKKNDMYKLAWEGGEKIISTFLHTAESYLKPDGRIIIVLSQYQVQGGKVDFFIKSISSNLQVQRSFKKHFSLETLYVVELTKKALDF